MTTCSVDGTTWRDPEVSGTGPWQGTTYSVKTLLPPETSYSLTPEESVDVSESTMSQDPILLSRLGGPPSIADARD